MMKKTTVSMEQIVNLAKRRGFVFPSAEIYGGLGGFYDYGPLGVLLKRNIETEWWKAFVQERSDILGIESTVVTHADVLKASGHIENFTDPLVECKVCHERFRADKPEELEQHPHKGQFTEPRLFHSMFKTFVGATDDATSEAYLRPENAQGMFTNYLNVLDTTRVKLPFGLAQVGRTFRNEITYRNFIFRLREFTIAEVEYFVKPGTDEAAFDSWLEFQERVLIERFGLAKDALKRYEHPKETLAHYSKRTVDLQFMFPWGWDELWGLANRRDYDLALHEKATGKSFAMRDPETNEQYRPFVIEPTSGIDRLFLAVMCNGYTTIQGGRSTTTESIKEEEMVLKLPPKLAPYKAAILPLSKKPELQKVAQEIATTLRKKWMIDYDETGSIGKRYRREDEIGTPWCITVDFDTVEGTKRPKGTVTVRDRDTMQQEDVAIGDLTGWLEKKLE